MGPFCHDLLPEPSCKATQVFRDSSMKKMGTRNGTTSRTTNGSRSVFLFLVSLLIVPSVADRGNAQSKLPSFPTLLVLEKVGTSGRSPLFTDAIEFSLVTGKFASPQAGDNVMRPDGTSQFWKSLTPDEGGWFKSPALGGGYGFATVNSDQDRVLVMNARGHRHVYINGVPRGGDLYAFGMTKLPIALRKGENTFLFKGGRGRLKIQFEELAAEISLQKHDLTTPDFLVGSREPLFAGIPVFNGTQEWQRNLLIRSKVEGSTETVFHLPPLPPLSMRKLAAPITPPASLKAKKKATVRFEVSRNNQVLHAIDVDLNVKSPQEKHKRTFLSTVDGSVQYFAVTPMKEEESNSEAPALFLSLHGAGVEGTNQAFSYKPKDWGHIVAPTNRRAFGFDWEDWGRLDALEVLEIAKKLYGADPLRTYLTGHSMGGHGTWNLGVHFPNLFAAIAPSAGWRDFWSYAASENDHSTPVGQLLHRASNASRTLLLSKNLSQRGVYILHGDRDDNVPVSQARFMREHLSEFHPNFAYYEKPGAGHWWGNQCMDWPPLFDFLAQNTQPEEHEVRTIEFRTVNPGISSRLHWIEIEAQDHWNQVSLIRAELDPKVRAFSITEENVSQFALHLSALQKPRTRTRKKEEVDATVLKATPIKISVGNQSPIDTNPSPGEILHFRKDPKGAWNVTSPLKPAEKNSRRAGPFKDAFRNDMAFVFATSGSSEENSWAFSKARFDAETYWYRGNGDVDLIADKDFDPKTDPDRGIVLYGNADTNRAWDLVLKDPPLSVHREGVRVGERMFQGDDLACLFVFPRDGSTVASVAVVAGTGMPGSRLTHQLPYFVSGAGFPDWMIIRKEMLLTGIKGVLAAGFFDGKWKLRSEDSGFFQGD